MKKRVKGGPSMGKGPIRPSTAGPSRAVVAAGMIDGDDSPVVRDAATARRVKGGAGLGRQTLYPQPDKPSPRLLYTGGSEERPSTATGASARTRRPTPSTAAALGVGKSRAPLLLSIVSGDSADSPAGKASLCTMPSNVLC